MKTIYKYYFLNLIKILAAIIFLKFLLFIFLISFPFIWIEKWHRKIADIGEFLEKILYMW